MAPLTLYFKVSFFNARLATTATSCVVPWETEKGSLTRSAAWRPTEDNGSSGSSADLASDSANGMFFSYSAWIRPSSSGKLKPLMQSSASHSSSGSESDTVWQVVISGVKLRVPLSTVACPLVSPFVV